LAPRTPETSYLIARRWQLTNTRYLLGPAEYLESLNQQLDPERRRFQISTRFDIVPKPEITQAQQLQDLTAVINPNGQYALFDFTGVLPRACVFTGWQVETNDDTTLKTLAARDFDPLKTVLVSTPVSAAPSASGPDAEPAEYKSYSPRTIVLSATAPAPSILLLNDRYDPNWKVLVDGKPAELLRCNFIMRGVYLPPGAHTVEFRFRLPIGPFYFTLAGIALAMILSGILVVWTRKQRAN
ncbi:MAG TPA: hypothetical protein VN625_01795, partial [Desulfuromonadaceae bacterium]|nr:hypothetical protein [Desulfuromonadaceae bacterium]